MILDHKKRFRDSTAHKQWHEATASDWFQAGLAASMLEVMRNLPNAQDMGTASANAWRLQGAQMMQSAMMNLTETNQPQKPPQDQNLNYEA